MDRDTTVELNWKEYVVDRLDTGVFLVDQSLTLMFWNRFMAMHTGRSAEAVIGRRLPELFPELPLSWLQRKIDGVFVLKNQAFSSWEQRHYLFKFSHNRPMTGDIDAMYQDLSFMPILDMGGQVAAVCISVKDVTDAALYATKLKVAHAKLEQEKAEQLTLIKKLEEAQSQLLQSEKMAAIGQLAAGVAHEINNPVGFIKSNISSLKKYNQDLFQLLDAYGKSEDKLQDGEEKNAIAEVKEAIDYEFLVEDIGSLIEESTEGVDRVSQIVKDLKDFSHVDQGDWKHEDLHHCLDSTLNVAWNELKYTAEIDKQYGNIPQVYCMGSQINQVFLNILVNAAHAIETRGIISISTTTVENDRVCISIRDTGVGMDEDQLRRVFEPFYTTKPVGKGTGLGMSLSYGIIEKHDGEIQIESTPGVGTCFSIFLPIEGPAEQMETEAG